jgi:heat shock protein HtpX
MAATEQVNFDSAPFRTDFYKEIASNRWKSWLLVLVVIAILSAMVYVMSYLYGYGLLAIGGIFIIIYSLSTYFWGDKVVLAYTGAKLVDENNPKELQFKNMVENLAFAARLPVAPKAYIIQNEDLNAFATGRDPQHASIAITTGLLTKLTRDELEGVVAHETSHVANYDIRFATLVAVMVGLVAILSDLMLRMTLYGGKGNDRRDSGTIGIVIMVAGLILAILAPFIVRAVQAAVSRKREFLADASGAYITRYPEGLARALEKIKANNSNRLKVNEAVSHLFFADPVKSSLDSMFATHPPIDERIKILRGM